MGNALPRSGRQINFWQLRSAGQAIDRAGIWTSACSKNTFERQLAVKLNGYINVTKP